MRFVCFTAVLIVILVIDFAAVALGTKDAHGWDVIATAMLVFWIIAYLFGDD